MPERGRLRWAMSAEARVLAALTLSLVVFGLATLYSASALVALQQGRPGSYYFGRQVEGALVGVILFALAAKWDAERLERWAWPLMYASILLMLLTVLPFTESLAPRVNGSRRFVIGTAIQPSELGKLAVVVWTSMVIVKKGERVRLLRRGILPVLAVIGVLDLLAFLEPDLSVAMLYSLVAGLLLFAGGARIGHFVFLGALATPLIWQQAVKLQYAVLRVVSFWDPGAVPEGIKYQLKQSLIAVGSGGFFGRGFGNGRQQYGFVPLGYNDFIASTIGEEWGFVGMLAVVLAFGLYGYLGFRIARSARTPFLQLVAVGLTFVTVVTAFLHLAVVVGLVPTTGVTLPFVSYGRTNLLLSLFTSGILVNIGSRRERAVGMATTSLAAARA
jgi:cell division protein FtsW